MRHAFAKADFAFTDPARLWIPVIGLNLLVKNVGTDGIKMVRMSGGGYRGSYHMTNSPQVRAEFDLAADTGLVTAHRVFSKAGEPVIVSNLRWKRARGSWFVDKLSNTRDYRRVESNRMLTKSEFKYETFEVNADIDPKLFTLASVPIPVGTRFIDNSPRAEHLALWFDGEKLTPTRVPPKRVIATPAFK